MINLIPPDARKKVMAEYWVRAVSVGLMLVSLAFLVVAVLLTPPFVLLRELVDSKEVSLTSTQQQVIDYDVSAKALVQATNLARMVVEGDATASFTSLISIIVAAHDPDLITIKGYTFTQAGSSAAPAIVMGDAKTRQSLADFQNALEANPMVTSVNLPLSNLAKDRDIPFSLTITFASSTTP